METVTQDGGVIIGIETPNADGTTHRRILMPGELINGVWQATDLSGESDAVKAMAAQVWTPTDVAAFQARLLALYVPPSPADYAAAIQSVIDQTAQARGYADGIALAGYINSTVKSWALEASTFIAWRDQVWQYIYAQFAAVQAGQRVQPTIAQLIAELPVIQWPA